MQRTCAASDRVMNCSSSLSTVGGGGCTGGLIAFSNEKLQCVARVQLCICDCRCVQAHSKFES